MQSNITPQQLIDTLDSINSLLTTLQPIIDMSFSSSESTFVNSNTQLPTPEYTPPTNWTGIVSPSEVTLQDITNETQSYPTYLTASPESMYQTVLMTPVSNIPIPYIDMNMVQQALNNVQRQEELRNYASVQAELAEDPTQGRRPWVIETFREESDSESDNESRGRRSQLEADIFGSQSTISTPPTTREVRLPTTPNPPRVLRRQHTFYLQPSPIGAPSFAVSDDDDSMEERPGVHSIPMRSLSLQEEIDLAYQGFEKPLHEWLTCPSQSDEYRQLVHDARTYGNAGMQSDIAAYRNAYQEMERIETERRMLNRRENDAEHRIAEIRCHLQRGDMTNVLAMHIPDIFFDQSEEQMEQDEEEVRLAASESIAEIVDMYQQQRFVGRGRRVRIDDEQPGRLADSQSGGVQRGDRPRNRRRNRNARQRRNRRRNASPGGVPNSTDVDVHAGPGTRSQTLQSPPPYSDADAGSREYSRRRHCQLCRQSCHYEGRCPHYGELDEGEVDRRIHGASSW